MVRAMRQQRVDGALRQQRPEAEGQVRGRPDLADDGRDDVRQALTTEFCRTWQRRPAAVRPALVGGLPALGGRHDAIGDLGAGLVALGVERLQCLGAELAGLLDHGPYCIFVETIEQAALDEARQARRRFHGQGDIVDGGLVGHEQILRANGEVGRRRSECEVSPSLAAIMSCRATARVKSSTVDCRAPAGAKHRPRPSSMAAITGAAIASAAMGGMAVARRGTTSLRSMRAGVNPPWFSRFDGIRGSRRSYCRYIFSCLFIEPLFSAFHFFRSLRSGPFLLRRGTGRQSPPLNNLMAVIATALRIVRAHFSEGVNPQRKSQKPPRPPRLFSPRRFTPRMKGGATIGAGDPFRGWDALSIRPSASARITFFGQFCARGKFRPAHQSPPSAFPERAKRVSRILSRPLRTSRSRTAQQSPKTAALRAVSAGRISMGRPNPKPVTPAAATGLAPARNNEGAYGAGSS